jgi:spermidine synthase
VLNFFRANRPPGGVRVGDVGLGTGTLAAYVTKGDYLTVFEINPAVVEMATSGKWFTYVSDCRARGAHCDIKLGDARLMLEREVHTPQLPRYHVLVLDAFSGDAVPTHLLTAEAYDIYLPRLATEAVDGANGALMVHVSNRYLDLARVVRAAAERIHFDCPNVNEQLINSSDWMVLTRNKNLLAALNKYAHQPDTPPKPPVLWTDAHSSLFEIVR